MSRGAVGQDPSQGWANTTIGDLATRVGSGITPTGGAEVYAHSGVVFLRSQNVTNSGLLLDDVAFIDEATHSRMAASEVFPYDVLINITGASIGRCCYLPDGLGRANANQHVCAIRLSNPNWADAKFLSSLLASSIGQAQVRRFNAGGNREGLNYKQLRSFRLPWPAKESREKIAAVLSIIDDAIEQTEALIAKTQQIKAGLMHDLFTRGVTPDGHLRPRGQGTPTRFGLLPQGWVAGSLLDIADDSRQPILTGPFGADLGNDDFVAEGVPVLRIGNVQSGYLDLADLIFITPRKAKDLCRYIVKPGDLLFARQGATTGRNALATDLVAGCIINYHIIRVALGHDKCAPLFVEAAFNGEMVKRQVERDKGRGTREGINSAQLKALKVPLAPLSEQRAIAAILGGQNTQAGILLDQRTKLLQKKAGLMHDLLTGRVRVPATDSQKAAAHA